MDNSVTNEFFNTLVVTPHLKVVDKLPKEIQHQTLSEHYELNNGWARSIFEENPRKLVPNPTITTQKLDQTPISNEVHPAQNELLNQGEIDINKAIEYLSLQETTSLGPIAPLYKVQVPYRKTNDYSSIPLPAYRGKSGIVGLTLKDISTGGSPCTGFFQLYIMSDDCQSFSPLTEPLHFENNMFTQTINPEAYLTCQNSDPRIFLLCYIHKQTPNGRIPYGVASRQLFYEQDGKTFTAKNFNTFGNSFHALIGSDIKSCITNLIRPSEQKTLVPVHSEFQVRFIKFSEFDYTYSWLGNLDGHLRAVEIAPKHFCPTPVISIFDIEFTLKNPPKGTVMYFKAYVLSDQLKMGTQPQGMPVFTYTSPNKISEYTSVALPPNNLVTFNENIRIYINKQFNNQTHLVIIVYSLIPEKKEPTVYKIGFIPLYNTTNTLEDEPQKFILYDPKRMPKDYLKHQKPPNKTYISCRVNLPPAYCVFPSMEKFISSPVTDTIELPEGDKENLIAYVVPILAKMMTSLTLDNMKKFIEWFARFDTKQYPEIRQWTYNAFNPQTTNPNIINQLLSFLNTLMEDSIKAYITLKEDPQLTGFIKKRERTKTFLSKATDSVDSLKASMMVQQIMKQLPIYIDLLIVGIHEMKDQFDPNNVYLFFKIFAEFLYDGFHQFQTEDLFSTIDSISWFLFVSMNLFDFKEISECIFAVFRSIMALRTMFQDPAKKIENSQLQFRFLTVFALSKTFVVGLGSLTKTLSTKSTYSPYNKLLSMLFLAIYEGYTIENPDILKYVTSFLSMLCIHIENLPDAVASHVSFTMLPLLNIIFSAYESPNLKKTPIAQYFVAPFVLLILNKSSPEQLQSFFGGFPTSFQQQFISFLESIVVVIGKNGFERNINYFIQITQRLLKFLITILPLLGPSMPQVVSLCDVLLNKYQTPNNFLFFYHFLSQAIKQFPCERSLISTLLKRITSPLMSTRCLSTALLALQFRYDYTRNSSIVLSSIDTMDSLTAILLENDIDKIAVYNKFIKIIVEISSKWNDERFYAQVKERMGAASVIANVVQDQKASKYPPEIRCQQVMKIANQYNMYPTMRLKWLQECYKINIQNNDKISAFVTQLHVIALIATVYHHNKESLDTSQGSQNHFHLSVTQPIKYASNLKDSVENSFIFMPEVIRETRIDFASMQPVALGLLSDLTLSILTEEIERTISIGCEAGLYYSLRPIHSFQLRLHQRTRNFQECAKACSQLSDRFKSITTSSTLTHDNPIATYLVCDREKKTQNVFCVSKDTKILDMISASERGYTRPALCPKHAMGCMYQGTCIIPLDIDDDRCIDDEHSHCWQHFKSQVFISDYDNTDFNKKEINVLYVKTAKHIPHYRMAVEVECTEVVQYSVLELVTKGAEKTIRVCEAITRDLEMWFENAKNIDHEKTPDQLFYGETPKIMKTLDNILKGKDCLYDRLKRLRNQKPDEAKEIATQVRLSISHLMKIFGRFAAELPNIAMLNVHLNMYTVLVNDFCKDFQIPNIKAGQQFESYRDPMSQRFDFEVQDVPVL